VARTSTTLGALNELPVVPGDCVFVFVPAGVPHAIGERIFLIELQEPSDLSVLLEWTGVAVDGARDGHLGIGFDVALGCVVRGALGSETLASLKRATASLPEVRLGVRSLLPPEADSYFRAERLRPDPAVPLEPSFSILVVLDGQGRLETGRGGAFALARGDTVLVPYAVGAGELSGSVDVVRALPPLPAGIESRWRKSREDRR
jgi:mannose-6-phosphate isomerase